MEELPQGSEKTHDQGNIGTPRPDFSPSEEELRDWGNRFPVTEPQTQPQPWPNDGGGEPEFPPTTRQILDDDFLNMYGRDDA